MDGPETEGGPKRPSRGGVLAEWLGWIRSQPVLAAAFLGFCVVAGGGLILSLPRDTPSIDRTPRSGGGGSTSASFARTEASRAPGSSADGDPGTEPGPWVEKAPSPPSARGLALVYRYRTLPPGGESRYEWIVQVRAPRPVLEGIEVVNWRMDPAAKNEGDLTSRDRAADGFPLFGDGPGGWFGVSARIRHRDGEEETLARRIELSD